MMPGDIGHPDVPAVVPAACPRCGAPVRTAARYCRGCGTALAAAANPHQPSQGWRENPDEPTRRHRWGLPRRAAPRRTKRRRLLVTALVVVAAVGGYATIIRVQDRVDAPDATVREFYQALGALDARGAAALVGCTTAPLCRPGALTTGYTPPEHVTVGAIHRGPPPADDPTRRPNRNLATVTVHYQLAGKPHQDTMHLQRVGGGLQRTWTILTPPQHGLTIISPHLPAARLAAADVPTAKAAPAAGRSDVLDPVWPGIYTLTAPPQHPLFTAAPATVTVATGYPHRIQLGAAIKPGVVEEVTRQIRTRIDTCARQHDLHPAIVGAACPFAYNSSFVFTKDPQWTVTAYPVIDVQPANDGTATVRTTTDGHAKVTFAWTVNVIEPKHWTPADGIVDITIGGRVDIGDNNTLVWTG